jgi:uncharacterized protein (TIGR02145 family)/uncharacterized repeat protein (TIGR02543 family)
VPENCGDGNRLNSATEFCFGGQAYPKCGGGEYDPTVKKCEDGVLKSKCGGDIFYDPATEFCYGSQAYLKCGGGEYDPTVKKCEDGILKSKCGNEYYNPATNFCVGDSVYSKCGGEEYNPATATCESNVLKGKCGSNSYNPATDFCVGDSVYAKCGGQIYVPATETCENNVLKGKCGGIDYNPATENCSGGVISPITYTLTVSADPAVGGSVSREPDAETYNTGTSVTVTATPAAGYVFTGWSGASTATANVVQIRMDGNKTLTARFQMPAAGERYRVTFSVNGGSGTAPSDIFVNSGYSATLPSGSALSRTGFSFGGWNTESSGTGTNYAAGSSYYPTANITLYAKWTPPSTPVAFIDSRDGNRYNGIAIGTQVWMAENLNYDVPDVTTDICYAGSVDSCEKYGRLYDWSTAMGGASSSNKVPSGVQGVCPAGWHLPSYAEWDTLINFVGGESTAGEKLKSSRGWGSYRNGTDEYGFSALPGNRVRNDGYVSSSSEVGPGYWWSATESSDGDYAFYWSISYTGRVAKDASSKTERYGWRNSVRCVQDE